MPGGSPALGKERWSRWTFSSGLRRIGGGKTSKCKVDDVFDVPKDPLTEVIPGRSTCEKQKRLFL